MAQRHKEEFSIAGTVFGGMALAVLLAFAAGFAADKAFSDHLWPRILVSSVIVLVLGWLLFRKRGAGTRP